MPKYVAFLRALNLPGRTVRMAHLRTVFEDLRLANVETFIASGNVIFDSSARSATLENRIAQQLRESLGYNVSAFIRSTAEVTGIANYRPFDRSELNAEGNVLYVAFITQTLGGSEKKKLSSLKTAVDDFHVHDREIYWLRRTQMGESRFSGGLLEKAIGMQTTIRNLNTVKRIAERYAT